MCPLLYKLSFNPQSNLELGPYYIGFTTEGATLEVRGLPWVPLPGLLLQIMGFYPLHSQNYWTLSGHLREVEAAVSKFQVISSKFENGLCTKDNQREN